MVLQLKRSQPEPEQPKPDVMVDPRLCCDTLMNLYDTEYVCGVCGRIREITEHELEPIQSQKIKHYDGGKKVYGCAESSVKSEFAKKQALSKEFVAKIRNANSGMQIDGQMIDNVISLAMDVFDGNNKKENNRNQVFATCFKHVMRARGVNISKAELKKLFGVIGRGLGCGDRMLVDMFRRRVRQNPDINPQHIFSYVDVFDGGNIRNLPINIDMGYSYVTNLLQLANNTDYLVDLNTLSNKRLCTNIVDFLNRNGICYNVKLDNKCAGVVFYFLTHWHSQYFTGFRYGIRKTDLEKLWGIAQIHFTNVCNTLELIEIQLMFDPEWRAASQKT